MNIKISPVLCAALGAAVSYYCLFPLFLAGLYNIDVLLVLSFIPVAALCLFRVLASFPLTGEERHNRLFRLAAMRLTAVAAGLALGIGAGAKVSNGINFGIPENAIQGISGVLLDDPRIISGGRAMSILSLKMTSGSNGVRATANGEITVFFPEESADRLKEFGRGTEVFAEGILRQGTGSFSYTFGADAIHITKIAPPLERFRTGIRLGLVRRFTKTSPDGASWAGMALALLLGIRDNLDSGISSMYRGAGCSHILALSGMHLAVLAAIISILLKKPLGLKLSALTGAALIIVYCFIVGPLPSLNRAVFMYLLGVFAVIGMLKRDALSLLCLAFLIQLIVTPQAGRALSFILSYLALAGILIFTKSIVNIFTGTIPLVVLQPVSASVGAFIATAGVSAWFFGVLHPVGILAGLVLAPLATVFMVASLIWLGFDILFPAVSALLSKPLSFIYWLMEKTAFTASRVPGITVNPYLVLVLSLIVMVVILFFNYRRRALGAGLEPFA